MQVYQLLKDDHDKVAKLFKKLESTKNSATDDREDLFNTIRTELEIHTKIEEKLLYPALEDKDKTHDLTLEAIEEHHVVDALLKELDDMPKDSDEWMAKLTVLRENVEHHVKEEEEELFPKAQKVLSDAQAEELGKKTQQEKEALMAKTE